MVTEPVSETRRSRIPQKGIAAEAVLAHLKASRAEDVDWRAGRAFSLVYYVDEEHDRLLREASTLFFSENYLNPLAFRSLKQLETEVVQMTADLLHGDEHTVGCMTSGGTESIVMAVLAAREQARKSHRRIRRPEIVAPASIHVAFDKAAHLLGLKLIRVPVAADFRADVPAMRRHVTRNTVLLAASAPQFPQGVVDPIEELGALALEHKLPFHVDSCIGGFQLPWLEKLGYAIPPFDFRVPGVTSISADIHKYGYGAKGASVILYRSMTYMRHQFFVATDWSGGMYASPAFAGSRSGGPIAAAWAALQSLGEDGYLRLARTTMETVARLRDGIAAITELAVLGQPHMSLLAYASVDPDVSLYAIGDQLEQRGWLVDRQQRPDCIHLTVMVRHAEIVDAYLADLRAAVAEVKAHPELAAEGAAAMYGLMAKIPLRGMVHQQVQRLVEEMYQPEGGLPDFEQEQTEGEDAMRRLAATYGYRVLGWSQRLAHAWRQVIKRVSH